MATVSPSFGLNRMAQLQAKGCTCDLWPRASSTVYIIHVVAVGWELPKQLSTCVWNRDQLFSRLVYHKPVNVWPVSLLLILFSANASKGALSDFSQCRTSIVHNDVTLVGGINAGKFTDLGDAENMTICSQRCCFKDACDVAFMLEGECYGVKCINESLCETRPARNPARYNPKIVYVYHDRKKDEGKCTGIVLLL